MIATCKKLVTDIQRDKDLDKKLPEYAELLGRQYNCYATVKGSKIGRASCRERV